MYTCLLNEALMSQQCFHRELKQVSKLDKRLLVLKEENVNLKAVDDVTFLVKNVCVIELPKLWFDQTSMMDFVVQKCDAILKTVIFCLIYLLQFILFTTQVYPLPSKNFVKLPCFLNFWKILYLSCKILEIYFLPKNVTPPHIITI
jgi:hypothetical protein